MGKEFPGENRQRKTTEGTEHVDGTMTKEDRTKTRVEDAFRDLNLALFDLQKSMPDRDLCILVTGGYPFLVDRFNGDHVVDLKLEPWHINWGEKD